jgi:hypothetical protein
VHQLRACEPECPNEAISEGEDIYVIVPDLCTECVGFHDYEACQAVCPVECCTTDPSNLEEEAALYTRALRLHPDKAFPSLAELPATTRPDGPTRSAAGSAGSPVSARHVEDAAPGAELRAREHALGHREPVVRDDVLALAPPRRDPRPGLLLPRLRIAHGGS